jgi:dipeptidase D
MESRQGVILQAHMDMVWQQAPGMSRDPLLDPIQAIVDGEWVVTDGTTLGADDGIGMAMAMAILQSEALKLGPLEVLFTVNEEDGMDGALGLQPGLLTGSILINLDQETEGEFLIGSAGGEYVTVEATVAEVPVPAGVAAFRLTVLGLKGGHSGVHIHLGRGHATKLLVRFLMAASEMYGLRLADLTGGTAANAIPREASALVVVPDAQVAGFQEAVQQFQTTVQAELAAVEPDLAVQAIPADLPDRVLDPQAQRTLIDALYATPQGVMRMSDAVPGLVETSTNLGIVVINEGQIEVKCLARSSVDTAVADVTQMIASVWDLAGMQAERSGSYGGWRPVPSSAILGLMQQVYRELCGQEAQATAIHAGLECGTIGSKVPGLDMISIGPTLQDVHSPAERLKIATVQKVMDLLVETLKRIPEK